MQTELVGHIIIGSSCDARNTFIARCMQVWTLAGDTLAELVGHTAIVFCVAAMENGLIASGKHVGWLGWLGDIMASLPLANAWFGHTAIIFCVAAMENGMIAAGKSMGRLGGDGVDWWGWVVGLGWVGWVGWWRWWRWLGGDLLGSIQQSHHMRQASVSIWLGCLLGLGWFTVARLFSVFCSSSIN